MKLFVQSLLNSNGGKEKKKSLPSGRKSMDVILKGGIEKQQWPDLQRANVSCIELGEVCGICQPPELWSIETVQHSSAAVRHSISLAHTHPQKHVHTYTHYRCLKVTCRESAWLTRGWKQSLQFQASNSKAGTIRVYIQTTTTACPGNYTYWRDGKRAAAFKCSGKEIMNLLTLWKGNCNFDAAVKKKRAKTCNRKKRRKIKRHTGIDSILNNHVGVQQHSLAVRQRQVQATASRQW